MNMESDQNGHPSRLKIVTEVLAGLLVLAGVILFAMSGSKQPEGDADIMNELNNIPMEMEDSEMPAF